MSQVTKLNPEGVRNVIYENVLLWHNDYVQNQEVPNNITLAIVIINKY